MIRILIADDHTIVRSGLKTLLSTEPDLRIIGEAVNGEEAVKKYKELSPDLAILDFRIPILNGVEATKAIVQHHPDAHILILSTYEEIENVYRALEAGASGYILKAGSGTDLTTAIRAVAKGQTWVSPELRFQLASRKSEQSLSTREVEVLQFVAAGDSNKEIASSLNITEHTIKAHLKNILLKLNVRDRTEAVTEALSRGIINLPD